LNFSSLKVFFTYCLTLSPRFNGISPGEPGLASVHWSKGYWKCWWQLEL